MDLFSRCTATGQAGEENKYLNWPLPQWDSSEPTTLNDETIYANEHNMIRNTNLWEGEQFVIYKHDWGFWTKFYRETTPA